MFGNRFQTVFFDTFTFRSAQVRGEDHSRALFDCILDRWQRRADTRVVVNLPFFGGAIEVDSDEDALPFSCRSLIESLFCNAINGLLVLASGFIIALGLGRFDFVRRECDPSSASLPKSNQFKVLT